MKRFEGAFEGHNVSSKSPFWVRGRDVGVAGSNGRENYFLAKGSLICPSRQIIFLPFLPPKYLIAWDPLAAQGVELKYLREHPFSNYAKKGEGGQCFDFRRSDVYFSNVPGRTQLKF